MMGAVDVAQARRDVREGARTVMITLAWGNFLTLVPPGVILLFAFQKHAPNLQDMLASPNALQLPGAFYLLLLAILGGGVLEALRRSTLDLWLPALRRGLRPSSDAGVSNIYEYVTPQNLDLFQAATENSYKYYTFYGNLLWALVVFVVARVYDGLCGRADLALLLTAVVVGRAAYIQYDAYTVRMHGFVAVERLRREGANVHG